MGGGRAGCGVVLAYMCYSCSNIVVFSIHIHAFKKASCVHGSIVSPIMFPPYSNHRQGDSITSAWAALSICVYVCVCVSIQKDPLCVRISVSYDRVLQVSPKLSQGNPALFQCTLCQTLSALFSAWCHRWLWPGVISTAWPLIAKKSRESKGDIEIEMFPGLLHFLCFLSPTLISHSLWSNCSPVSPFLPNFLELQFFF